VPEPPLPDRGEVGALDAHRVAPPRMRGDAQVAARGKPPADVQPAGRTRREPGDFGARGQVARRVALFPVRRLRQTRREQRVNEILAQHDSPAYRAGRASPDVDAACPAWLP